MRPLMSENKQRFLSTLIVSCGAVVGFEALAYIVGIYQIKTYISLAFYIYIFHALWLTFLFDLHLKKRGILASLRLTHHGMRLVGQALKERVRHLTHWDHLRHYQNYLILPAIIYWSVVVLLFLNPFRQVVKQFIILTAGLSMSIAYWYFKERFNARLEQHETWLKVLNIVKLFTAFLAYSGAIGLTWYYGLGVDFLIMLTFVATFLLLYQALFQHKLLSFRVLLFIIIIAAIISLVSALVYYYWGTNYLSGGLVLLSIYNMLWGIFHHYLDQKLNRRIFLEYVLMMILILSFLFASHDFRPQVL